MSKEFISPVENFDWEAYENGEVFGGKSREELEAAYNQTLNAVSNHNGNLTTLGDNPNGNP